MQNPTPASPYDTIAGMYHAMWGRWYLPGAMTALEKLFFSKIDPGARVLDVCCGSGHVTRELVRRDYRVTGIDSSAELIAIARRDLPQCDLRVEDARWLPFNGGFDAALSTFDSLNHLMTIDDLRSVFAGVYAALEPGGRFVFDMNLEEAYSIDLRQWTVRISDESVGLVRGTYHPATKIAVSELVWFVREGTGPCWHRLESTVEERCYTEAEVVLSLQAANFREVSVIPAIRAGVDADLGFGRVFVSARRQANETAS